LAAKGIQAKLKRSHVIIGADDEGYFMGGNHEVRALILVSRMER
jgi:hypothetical protein